MDFSHRPGADPDGQNPPNTDVTQGPESESRNPSGIPAFQKESAHKHGQSNRRKRRRKGSGDKAGPDGTDSETDKGAVPRYPRPNYSTLRPLECPFAKYDPARYVSCRGIRLLRLADITQHIRRRHLLHDPKLHPDIRADIKTDKIRAYCPRCRHELHGPGAEGRLQQHMQSCQVSRQRAPIEETGVLLPEEYRDLLSEMTGVHEFVAKWAVIWHKCFPATPPQSPYTETAISQPEAQRILHEHPVSTTFDFQPLANIERFPNFDTSQLFDEWSNAFPDSRLSVPHGKQSTLEKPGHTPSVTPEPVIEPHDINRWNSLLKGAIIDIDYDEVHSILNNSFDQVAIGEYEWLVELRDLGLSTDEIADELLERSQHGPWIYSEFEVPDIERYRRDFHLPRCLHSRKEHETISTVSLQERQALASCKADYEKPVRDTIAYLCGIGGVRPMPDGTPNLQFGSVLFEKARSTAIVSLMNGESFQAVPGILQHLEKAIGSLQQVGGCCDSFTFLAKQESTVELERIDPNGASAIEPLVLRTSPKTSFEELGQELLSSLTAQFYSLAFTLYAQGHCEPFRPCFLDTPLERILLIGNQIWGPSFNGPCILASPVELSCFGQMIERRVFTFQYFAAFERSKVFSDYDIQFDLKACPEDLLDTWGPGNFITPKDDSQKLHAIYIGGGLITSTSAEGDQAPVLHWQRASGDNTQFSSTFSRNEKLVVGSRVSINQDCQVTSDDRIRMARYYLKELGTFSSYWELSERQLGLGLQAGSSAVGILNFTQTWVKRLGQSKKSNILAKGAPDIPDLEGPFAVQVSFCTGIARRVWLRELLADILPDYVAHLTAPPSHWEELQGRDILGILRADDFTARFMGLDSWLREAFGKIAFDVLFSMKDTGVDREHENFVVGCVAPNLPIQCMQIPIEGESIWAQILADTEEVATFAYVAPRCFQTREVTCRGSAEPWGNITGLFWTVVSPYSDPAPIADWTLQDAEAYHIGRSDRPLVVRVCRPSAQDEPQLRISMSKIGGKFLNRLSMKIKYNTLHRLRESNLVDYHCSIAKSVTITLA